LDIDGNPFIGRELYDDSSGGFQFSRTTPAESISVAIDYYARDYYGNKNEIWKSLPPGLESVNYVIQTQPSSRMRTLTPFQNNYFLLKDELAQLVHYYHGSISTYVLNYPLVMNVPEKWDTLKSLLKDQDGGLIKPEELLQLSTMSV